VIVKGCHCCFDTDGTFRNSHCPALYFIDGLVNWISIASEKLLVRLERPCRDTLTVWVAHNSDNLGVSSRPDLAIEAFPKVQSTSPQLPAPAFISYAVVPEVGFVKWRKWVGCVTDEAPGGMSIEREEERDKKMVRVPEGLEGLLANLSVSGCVHEKHA
jgi:hypothetical protein